MEISSWVSSGSRVVMRCNHRPGCAAHRHRTPWDFAANRMNSYEAPTITGSSTILPANFPANDRKGRNMYKTIAIAMTTSRKLVPQRG